MSKGKRTRKHKPVPQHHHPEEVAEFELVKRAIDSLDRAAWRP